MEQAGAQGLRRAHGRAAAWRTRSSPSLPTEEEERAGERSRVFIGFPLSPTLPRSFLAGRGRPTLGVPMLNSMAVGLGRGGAFLLVAPLLGPLPTRSSRGEDGELDAALSRW